MNDKVGLFKLLQNLFPKGRECLSLQQILSRGA